MSDMKRFIVSVADTVEDSSYIIDAANAREAAMLYLDASVALGQDEIPVDPTEVLEQGEVTCTQLPEIQSSKGLVSWGDMEKSKFKVLDLIPEYEDYAAEYDDNNEAARPGP